jgi:hypothetical protein
MTPRSLDEAAPPPERATLLGIFSGKPMSPLSLPPPEDRRPTAGIRI